MDADRFARIRSLFEELAELSEEDFKQARLESGADIPLLGDELAQIEALQESLGWPRDRTLGLVTELYRRRVMDARSKVGLSVTTLQSSMSSSVSA